jgi:hypothetical protein
MPSAPDNWIVREGRDPEKELHSIQKRFSRIARRHERRLRLLSLLNESRRAVLPASIVFAVAFAAFYFSPFPPRVTVEHVLAFPNCAMAHVAGLFPSRRGEPGYWPHLDRDDDGIACEEVPQ